MSHWIAARVTVTAWLVTSMMTLSAQAGPIRIGQTADFSGPAAANMKEATAGAQLVFKSVNAKGGVNGQQIELVSLDDKFDPKLAAENAKVLLEKERVRALFLTRGTPHAQAILPLLEQYKVPLVAPSTGAMLLHKPVNPWVFNVRATYQRESEHATRYLTGMGLTRIAVVQTDDSFGSDAVQGALRELEKAKLEPVFVEKLDRANPDVSRFAETAVKFNPQAVLFFTTSGAMAKCVEAMRDKRVSSMVVTLSHNASSGTVKLLGKYATGVVMTQAFPSERAVSFGLVKEANEMAKAAGQTVTPAMLEGFSAAKVLVEGLKRAGADADGSKIAAALGSIEGFNLGGLPISYSADDHTGLDYSDISVVGRDGLFRR